MDNKNKIKLNNIEVDSLVRYIGFILVLISMVVTATIWASSKEAEIKDWVARRDKEVADQIEKHSEDKYCKEKELSKIEEEVKGLRRDVTEIKELILKLIYNSKDSTLENREGL